MLPKAKRGDDRAPPRASAGKEVLASWAAALGALGEALHPVIEQVQEWMGAAEPRLREFALGIAQATEIFEHAPATLKGAISSKGLMVPVSQMSFPDLVALLELLPDAGEDIVVERLRTYYEGVFGAPGFLDQLAATWAAHPLLKRRISLLHEALEAHKRRMFAVSIPTLIAQFEGLVADAVNHTGSMGGAVLRSYAAKLAGGEAVTGCMFTSFVSDVFLVQFKHGAIAPPFSRHAILHGGDIHYATEVNSRTAILLIDNLREMTGGSIDFSRHE